MKQQVYMGVSIRRLIFKNYVLLLILIIAVGLRFIGVYPGHPPYHSDEGISYSAAASMVKNNNLDPLRYDYPAAVPLVNFIFFKVLFIPIWWMKFFLQNADKIVNGTYPFPFGQKLYGNIFQFGILGEREVNALFWGRTVTAFFGSGMVLLTYLVGKNFFSKNVGLIASFLVAVNYREVLNSHIGLPDIYNGFFLMLGLLVCYRLLLNPSTRNFVWAGVACGISFSVKYQLYVLGDVFLVSFILLLQQKNNYLQKIVQLFGKNLMTLLITLVIALAINTYSLIHWQLARHQLWDVLLKYGVGSKEIYLYPFSYLFHFGVGQALSLICFVGIFYGFCRHFRVTLLLLFPTVATVFTLTFYTTGGFYTRNFIPLIPLILIFSALGIYLLVTNLLKVIRWHQINIVLAIVVIASCWSNIRNSIIVDQAYSGVWNYKIMEDWIDNNIARGMVVAAHSSVPLNDYIKRVDYDFDLSFTVDEFAGQGANYAIANLDWETSEFYYWMKKTGPDAVRYWNKPVDILEQTYDAMALRELAQFTVFSEINPWQAHDSNFIVARIPKFSTNNKQLAQTYSFDHDTQGWVKAGKFWYPEDNLLWKDGALTIFEQGPPVDTLSWVLPPINVSGWSGFVISGEMKTGSGAARLKSGYLYIKFYQTSEDAVVDKNRLGVRLSSRVDRMNEWVEKEVIGEVPKEARYMVVGFASYKPSQYSNYLRKLSVYKAEVRADYGKDKVKPFYLSPDNLFPNSHGEL